MKKKILLVGWGYPPKIDGGLDIHVKHLFEELRKKDVEVDLALPKDRAPEKDGIIPVETGDGDMVQRSRELSQEVAKFAEDYDIVHTHDWFGVEAGLKAKKYSNVKWVATFHSLSSLRSRKSSEKLEKMERAMAERSDTLIAVSELLADQVEEEFGNKPKVIHNGFSRPSGTGRNVKRDLGIKKMIFFVGRHAEQKGLEHLIYGFSKFLEDNDATLVVGGEGHMTKALKEFAEMLEIKDDVIFEGFIPDDELGDYYRSADVFVSPSIHEPFGLTVTEAIESGTPVVATESGVEEVLPEDAVIRVRPESDSIAEGIEKGLDKKVAGFKGRSWSEMAEETFELYNKVN